MSTHAQTLTQSVLPTFVGAFVAAILALPLLLLAFFLLPLFVIAAPLALAAAMGRERSAPATLSVNQPAMVRAAVQH